MASKYVDVTAIMQVVGNVFNNPQILDFTDKYTITEDDFPDEFHRVAFGAIYKIHELGADRISLENIADFLSSRPKSAATFKQNKGEEWLLKVSETCMPEAFDYYYSRLKKFSLLRAYDNYGVDVSDIYDADNILDTRKKQLQEDILDNSTLEQIADKVENKIEGIRLKYVDDAFGEAIQAGDDIEGLIDRLKEHPEVGVPLYGPLINTVTRGARLRKLYLHFSQLWQSLHCPLARMAAIMAEMVARTTRTPLLWTDKARLTISARFGISRVRSTLITM